MKRTLAFGTAVVGMMLIPLSAKTATIDYGSGTLGSWSGYSHSTQPAGSTAWATADVGIVGDSITSIGWKRLQYWLSVREGQKLAVNYWSGRPTGPAVTEILAQYRATGKLPKVLIMATGANDIFNPTVMASEVQRLRAGVPATTKVIWVDVFVKRWAQTVTVQNADQQNSMWVNMQIWGSGVSVCSWATNLVSKKTRQTAYLKDGVHPNSAGQDNWGLYLALCVERFS